MRMFFKDFDGGIKEIPQNKMNLNRTEAVQLFTEFDQEGEKKVMIPNKNVLDKFNIIKDQS